MSKYCHPRPVTYPGYNHGIFLVMPPSDVIQSLDAWRGRGAPFFLFSAVMTAVDDIVPSLIADIAQTNLRNARRLAVEAFTRELVS